MKEMTDPGCNRNRKCLRPGPVQHSGQRHRVVLLAVHHQGFEVCRLVNRGSLHAADAGANQYQFFNIADRMETFKGMRGDICAKRKAGQRQRDLIFSGWRGVLRHRQKIIQFAPTLVVVAGTAAHTPEVEPHRRPAALHKGPRQRLYHLIVHGAAEQGVWMGNDGHTAGTASRRIKCDFKYADRALKA